MLHHPFRDVELSDLMAVDDTLFEDWEEAYDHCRQHHSHPSDPLGDLLTAQLPSSDETLSDLEQEAQVSWTSKRQQPIAFSSCEAEYMAQTQAAKEAIWLTRLLSGLDVGSGLPTITRVQ